VVGCCASLWLPCTFGAVSAQLCRAVADKRPLFGLVSHRIAGQAGGGIAVRDWLIPADGDNFPR